jgi:hypothetical protein
LPATALADVGYFGPPGGLELSHISSRAVFGAATEPGAGFTSHLSGRIERPALLSGVFGAREAAALVGAPEDPVPAAAGTLWELSEEIGAWAVPGHGQGAGELTLHQAPLRAVRGSTWTQAATCWREEPHAYGAIHFYPDYDLHLDDTMVVFSSWRRPNLFMWPGHSRHEAYASDLYLIAWLERLGLDYDVFTDEDLHFAGPGLLAPYPVVISSSHPEYLSVAMHDSLRGWVEGGGRLLYLGGNGWTSDVTWHPERPWLMENRTTGRMRVTDTAALAAEAWNQGDGEKGGQLADTGRSPGRCSASTPRQ